MFEEHDRNRFRVVGYSYGSDDGSHIRQRIKTGFDRFVELNQSSDTESAQRITEDEVDILVDLTGHTRGQRLDILANRPAPVMAGCPVLTCVGEAFSARVAGSLLRSVGLPELVTTTWDEYQSMALDLARNPLRLAELRNRLAANREQTSLFKMDVFARNIEKAYVKMWAIHTAGELPRSFCV